MQSAPSALDIINKLCLKPHPEGGFYRETFRDSAVDGSRGPCTAIYYLLSSGEKSHWHRVDATEIWHWYAGAPLELSVSTDGKSGITFVLGNAVLAGQHPQAVVPKFAWQSARTLGDYTLVGCTVAPAFQFEGFELAPPNWNPA